MRASLPNDQVACAALCWVTTRANVGYEFHIVRNAHLTQPTLLTQNDKPLFRQACIHVTILSWNRNTTEKLISQTYAMATPYKVRHYKKRPLKFRSVWISDVYLGFKGCIAEYLLDFLSTTESDFLYLVGDIVDLWVMKKKCAMAASTLY